MNPESERKNTMAAKRKPKSDKSDALVTRESPAIYQAASSITMASSPLQFRDLRNSLGVTQQNMQTLSGVSVRKISALETGEQAPSADDARRFNELLRLRQELASVMASDSIASWLRTPSDYLDGSSPLQVIERGETDRIWRLVWRMQDGVPLD